MSESTATAPASAATDAALASDAINDSADYDALITEYGGDDAPASDPAPEPVAESKPEEPAKEPAEDPALKGKTVQGLHAENVRLRQRAQRAEEAARKAADAALEIARGRQPQPQPQQAQQPEIPDVNTDPVGHFQAKTALLERQLAQLTQPLAAQAQEAKFAQAASAAAKAFAADTPDYQDAYTHAVKVMQGMAQALGVSPGEVERDIAIRAMRAGKNPGQAVYEFARAAGYAGPKPAAPPAPEPERVMETLERGATASRGVGGGGGRTAPRVTLESLANMSTREYAEFSRKHPDLVERAYREGG